MMRVEVRELGESGWQEWVEQIGRELRESDRQEMLGMSGVCVHNVVPKLRQNVEDTLRSDGRVWVGMMDGVPVAVFGARPVSHVARAAEIFMVATQRVEAWPLAFARWSRRGLAVVMEAFPEIESFYNWVPHGSWQLWDWLKWLGASFTHGGWHSPWTGEVFVRFEIARASGVNTTR